MPLLCHAASLLESASFPKTTGDLSFVDRMAVLESGYEIFKDLSPYDQLNIIYTDQGINDEVAADDLRDAQQAEQKTGNNDTQNTGVTPVTTTPSSPADTGSAPAVAATSPAPVTTTPSPAPATTTPSPAPATGYCAQSAPHIPKNQKVPVGKPVLESDYKFCSGYGVRNMGKKKDKHYGMDIGCTLANFDRPVYTPADGVVERVKPNGRGSSAGNYIVINHENGFTTKYMHLNTMLVTRGQRVQAGCQIATIGYTGGAKAFKKQFANNDYPTMRKEISHLHYEIHYKGPLKTVTGLNGKTVSIVHKLGNSNAIDPKPFMVGN